MKQYSFCAKGTHRTETVTGKTFEQARKDAAFLLDVPVEQAVYLLPLPPLNGIPNLKEVLDVDLVRLFLLHAMSEYEKAEEWFTDWLKGLYIRLDEHWRAITLDEVTTLAALYVDGSWQPQPLAFIAAYRLFKRLGRDTAGIEKEQVLLTDRIPYTIVPGKRYSRGSVQQNVFVDELLSCIDEARALLGGSVRVFFLGSIESLENDRGMTPIGYGELVVDSEGVKVKHSERRYGYVQPTGGDLWQSIVIVSAND